MVNGDKYKQFLWDFFSNEDFDRLSLFLTKDEEYGRYHPSLKSIETISLWRISCDSIENID